MARRLKVCVVSLNEPNEIDAFRAALDPRQFEIVDIRAVGGASIPPAQPAPGLPSASWLFNSCRPDTTCDVAVYSAEFAGDFFGKTGSLRLQEMEEASCQAQCAGLFQKPLEVFLLACNTLATKDEDTRTPDQYLRVLLEHGFDRTAAERVVELRYGPLGPSFRESLRRVFAGVPRIYGFSSVAPRGAYTAPMLARYFRGKRDYAADLRRRARDTGRNTALLASFKGTSLTQTGGLTSQEAGAMDRAHICSLYDEKRSVTDHLRTAYGLLVRPDALRFVPTVQVFLARHPAEKFSRADREIFTAIQDLDATRHEVLQLVRKLNVSALKLELAHFALLVGWLHQTEFHTMAVDAARELLRQRPSAEVVDIMCAITKHESLRTDFRAADISPGTYQDAQGLRLLSCLAPADPPVSARIVEAMQSRDAERREWAAYALTQIRPREESVLVKVAPYLRDPSPAIAERMGWLLQAQGPLSSGVERAIKRAAQTHPERRMAAQFNR